MGFCKKKMPFCGGTLQKCTGQNTTHAPTQETCWQVMTRYIFFEDVRLGCFFQTSSNTSGFGFPMRLLQTPAKKILSENELGGSSGWSPDCDQSSHQKKSFSKYMSAQNDDFDYLFACMCTSMYKKKLNTCRHVLYSILDECKKKTYVLFVVKTKRVQVSDILKKVSMGKVRLFFRTSVHPHVMAVSTWHQLAEHLQNLQSLTKI